MVDRSEKNGDLQFFSFVFFQMLYCALIKLGPHNKMGILVSILGTGVVSAFENLGLCICMCNRAANVFPCAYIVNRLRPASTHIPVNHQKALWFSGA